MSVQSLMDTVHAHLDSVKLCAFLHHLLDDGSTAEVALVAERVLHVSNAGALVQEVTAGGRERYFAYHSLVACKHFIWERLNTGHWKDVELRWRQLYAAVCVLEVRLLVRMTSDTPSTTPVSSTDIARDLVRICDMGLLLGAPILNNLCGRLASALCQLCLDDPDDDCSIAKRRKHFDDGRIGVQTLPDPGIDGVMKSFRLPICEFVQNFMLTATPVVIDGMMEHWPAMSDRQWSVDYIRRTCGFRSVPVELGSRYTDDDWTQTIMTVNDFIDGYISSDMPKDGVKGYLAQHQLFDQIAELRDDIEVPDYCHSGEEEEVDINSWFGPGGTVSPLHTDPKHNLLCQVFGQKYVRLFGEDQGEYLYPYPQDQLLSNTSQLDLEDVDLEKFPKFKEARGFACILEQGQMLYIPPRCWHFVKSLSPSFSVSFWFQ